MTCLISSCKKQVKSKWQLGLRPTQIVQRKSKWHRLSAFSQSSKEIQIGSTRALDLNLSSPRTKSQYPRRTGWLIAWQKTKKDASQLALVDKMMSDQALKDTKIAFHRKRPSKERNSQAREKVRIPRSKTGLSLTKRLLITLSEAITQKRTLRHRKGRWLSNQSSQEELFQHHCSKSRNFFQKQIRSTCKSQSSTAFQMKEKALRYLILSLRLQVASQGGVKAMKANVTSTSTTKKKSLLTNSNEILRSFLQGVSWDTTYDRKMHRPSQVRPSKALKKERAKSRLQRRYKLKSPCLPTGKSSRKQAALRSKWFLVQS